MNTHRPEASLIGEARELLVSWRAPDPEQEQLRRDFLALALSSHSATFRESAPDHITASALIFSAEHDQVALLFHPKFDRWLQMGGHCESSDADLPAAALREACEESGLLDADLELDPRPVLLSRHAVKCWPDGSHYDVQFMAVAARGATLTCSSESTEVRWFDLDEALKVSDESVSRLVKASLQRLGA